MVIAWFDKISVLLKDVGGEVVDSVGLLKLRMMKG